MTQQESHRHHFVPEFLLKPWAINGELNGFWWDGRMGRLSRKRMGCKAFCFKTDLLTVNHHEEGRDVLERKFFGDVDARGALARDCLLADGPGAMGHDHRCDFGRLLLSLEARRPTIVRRLRNYGTQYLSDAIDGDPDIQREMTNEGLAGSPSKFLEEQNISLEDEAVGSIQQLVDNPRIGGELINMSWHVICFGPFDGTLVLSDRPLVRYLGYDHPSAAWFLPLAPNAVFCAVNQPRVLDETTPRRLAKVLNAASAGQAEKYVFCADDTHIHWLPRFLAT